MGTLCWAISLAMVVGWLVVLNLNTFANNYDEAQKDVFIIAIAAIGPAYWLLS